MSLLKKIGLYAVKIVGIAAGLLPLVQSATGSNPTAAAVEDKLSKAFDVVATAEQMFTAAFGPDSKTGPDKLKAAVPFVSALILQTDALTGKHPKNEAAFADAVTRVTSALADVYNSFE